jgi:hypothetical protein
MQKECDNGMVHKHKGKTIVAKTSVSEIFHISMNFILPLLQKCFWLSLCYPDK